jgi:hypothetical protein
VSRLGSNPTLQDLLDATIIGTKNILEAVLLHAPAVKRIVSDNLSAALRKPNVDSMFSRS